MNRTDVVWTLGRLTIGTAVRIFAPIRVYGRERVPREGGVVLALNHFHWLDPPVFGGACVIAALRVLLGRDPGSDPLGPARQPEPDLAALIAYVRQRHPVFQAMGFGRWA